MFGLSRVVYMPEIGSMVPTPVLLQVTVWLEVPVTITRGLNWNVSFVPIVHVGCANDTRMPESSEIIALAMALVL